MNRLSTFRMPLIAALASFVIAGQASATWGWAPPKPSTDDCIVKAYADDRNEPRGANGSWNNPRFWSVGFEKGCDGAFIKQVTIDLRAGTDTNAFFDLSGGSKEDGAYGPVIGKLRGLSSSDVSFSPDKGDSSTLTLTFDDGAFKAGDRIWFGADTDYLGSNNASDVGRKGVGFSVTFGNGKTYNASFAEYARCFSKAKVRAKDCCASVIPTPSAMGLGLVMLGGLAVRRRRAA